MMMMMVVVVVVVVVVMMIMMMMVVVMMQEASASTLFSKSFEKVKDLLPDKFDEFGNPVAPAGFHAADDADDWELYLELIGGEEGGELEEEEEEAAEETPRRQLCVNELDVTASVTDIDWSAAVPTKARDT